MARNKYLFTTLTTILLYFIHQANSLTKGCDIKHAYYRIVCTKFEFWCNTKQNILTYEAICNNISLTSNDVVDLQTLSSTPSKIYDIEIHESDILELKSGMFAPFNSVTRLYIQTGNTRIIGTKAFAGLSKLDWLILKSNNISNIQQQAFVGLYVLKVLNLNENLITELSDNTFEGLSNIHYIGLKENKIAKIGDNTFRNLKELGVLFLNDNNLTFIGETWFSENSNLRFLWLQNNMLKKIPNEAFNKKPLLQEVLLQNNYLQEVNWSKLKGNISLDHNNLQEIEPFGKMDSSILDLSFNNFSVLPNYIFNSSQDIEELYLNDNNFEKLSVNVLFNLQNLRILAVQNNKIDEIALGTFKDLKFLQTLNISQNYLEHIDIGLFTGLRSLKFLDLSNNLIFNLEVSALYPLQYLKSLYIQNNNLNNINVENLLLHLKSLNLINLDNNKWNCDWLSKNLLLITTRRVSIYHGTTYKSHNVHGIGCVKSKFSLQSPDTPSIDCSSCNNIDVNSIETSRLVKNDVKPNTATSSHSTGIAVTSGIIVLLAIVLIFFAVKKYFLKMKLNLRRMNSNASVRLSLVDE